MSDLGAAACGEAELTKRSAASQLSTAATHSLQPPSCPLSERRRAGRPTHHLANPTGPAGLHARTQDQVEHRGPPHRHQENADPGHFDSTFALVETMSTRGLQKDAVFYKTRKRGQAQGPGTRTRTMSGPTLTMTALPSRPSCSLCSSKSTRRPPQQPSLWQLVLRQAAWQLLILTLIFFFKGCLLQNVKGTFIGMS